MHADWAMHRWQCAAQPPTTLSRLNTRVMPPAKGDPELGVGPDAGKLAAVDRRSRQATTRQAWPKSLPHVPLHEANCKVGLPCRSSCLEVGGHFQTSPISVTSPQTIKASRGSTSFDCNRRSIEFSNCSNWDLLILPSVVSESIREELRALNPCSNAHTHQTHHY